MQEKYQNIACEKYNSYLTFNTWKVNVLTIPYYIHLSSERLKQPFTHTKQIYGFCFEDHVEQFVFPVPSEQVGLNKYIDA